MCEAIEEWIKLVGPSLTTVALSGVLVQRFFVRRANQAAFVDYIVSELRDLRADALDYWAKSLSVDNHDQVKQLEVRIKGRVHSLVSELTFFGRWQTSLWRRTMSWISEKWPEWMPKGGVAQGGPKYLVAMLELYDACTDGDFETEEHQANPAKYFPICSTISAVKSELFRTKL